MIDLSTVEFVVINLQIIVFDMYSLYCTLTSMSKEENDQRLRRVTILKYRRWAAALILFSPSID